MTLAAPSQSIYRGGAVALDSGYSTDRIASTD